ncbi:MAG: hypothetical protein IPF99_29540 [Deltaproteobacteria bacterium]|nr:hypothetical protein [Deltaproteobacteria bacterium]
MSPRGNLFPCARMVGEDRDDKLVIGHLDTGIDRGGVGAQARPRRPGVRRVRRAVAPGASCACANLAETGTTHLPGGPVLVRAGDGAHRRRR